MPTSDEDRRLDRARLVLRVGGLLRLLRGRVGELRLELRQRREHVRRAVDEPHDLAAPFDVDLLAGLELARCRPRPARRPPSRARSGRTTSRTEPPSRPTPMPPTTPVAPIRKRRLRASTAGVEGWPVTACVAASVKSVAMDAFDRERRCWSRRAGLCVAHRRAPTAARKMQRESRLQNRGIIREMAPRPEGFGATEAHEYSPADQPFGQPRPASLARARAPDASGRACRRL